MTASRQLLVFLSLVTQGTALSTARQPTRPEPGAGCCITRRMRPRTHYLPLDRITRQKVCALKLVWERQPGEVELPEYGTRPSAFQNTRLMIDGVLSYKDRADQTTVLAFGLQ